VAAIPPFRYANQALAGTRGQLETGCRKCTEEPNREPSEFHGLMMEREAAMCNPSRT